MCEVSCRTVWCVNICVSVHHWRGCRVGLKALVRSQGIGMSARNVDRARRPSLATNRPCGYGTITPSSARAI